MTALRHPAAPTRHGPAVSTVRARLALAALLLAALGAPATAKELPPAPSRQYLAVVGFKTLTSRPEEAVAGAGLGEELACRLGHDRTRFELLERLQVNEVLAARGAAPCMLELGGEPARLGEADPEGVRAGKALTAELAAGEAEGKPRLYGADLLLLGSVQCDPQSLVAATRLVSVARGVVEKAVVAQVERTPRGLEHDLQALAVKLTEQWCAQLGLHPSDAMNRLSEDKPGLYLAWCRAQDLLLRRQFEQCTTVATEALRTTPSRQLFEALCETRDLAFERLIGGEKQGTPQWRRWIEQNLSASEAMLDYARALKTVAAYYAGRAQERAGDLKQAEEHYRECLRERPTRLVCDLEADADIQTPVIADGVAYAGSADRRLWALGLATRRVRWCRTLPDEAVTVCAVADGRLYAGTAGHRLVVFGAATGTELWRGQLRGDLEPPTLADGLVYLSSDSGGLGAFDPGSGQPRWLQSLDGSVGRSLVTSGLVCATVAGATCELRAFDSRTGAPRWSCPSYAYDAPCSPATAAGVVYVATAADRLRAVEAATGKTIWEAEAGEETLSWAPVLAEGLVLAPCSGGRLRAFDTVTGELRWEAGPGLDLQTDVKCRWLNPPAAAAGIIYVPWQGRRLRGLEARTGDLRSEFPLDCGNGGFVLGDGAAYALPGNRHSLTAVALPGGEPLWGFVAGDLMHLPVIVEGVACAGSLDHHLRGFSAGLSGADYAERATAGLMSCLLAQGRAAEALRYGARLWRESPGRTRRTREVMLQAAAAAASTSSAAGAGLQSRLLPRSSSTITRRAVPAAAEAVEGPTRGSYDDRDSPLVFTRAGDRLEATAAAGGKPLWEVKLPEAVQPYLLGDTVYLVSDEGPLRALDARSGRLRWTFDTGGETDEPLLCGGTLYVTSYDREAHFLNAKWSDNRPEHAYLRALDPATGRLRWEFAARQGLTGLPVVTDSTVYLSGTDGHLRALAAATGALQWDVELGAEVGCWVVAGTELYAGPDAAHLSHYSLPGAPAGQTAALTWTNDVQFWDYLIWGKTGLAVRKIAEGFPLGQIIRYDTWRSRDALAEEIDRLARPADQPNGLGDWDGRLALSLDPASLCPPELSVVPAESAATGIRPVARLYLKAAANDALLPRERLDYAREALRLAPGWGEARRALAGLQAPATDR